MEKRIEGLKWFFIGVSFCLFVQMILCFYHLNMIDRILINPMMAVDNSFNMTFFGWIFSATIAFFLSELKGYVVEYGTKKSEALAEIISKKEEIENLTIEIIPGLLSEEELREFTSFALSYEGTDTKIVLRNKMSIRLDEIKENLEKELSSLKKSYEKNNWGFKLLKGFKLVVAEEIPAIA